ncbi:MAG: leucyl/phenylalanyl-tRNA--protein transferase [Alphaproteobacteria bacterium]|jgi:leucyl/phenylalanyl-tRNA--protein transferase
MLGSEHLPEDVFGAPVIHPELAIQAYSIGLFPMADDRDDRNVHWVDPIERGVLPLDSFHVPKRLKRTVLNPPYQVRSNTAVEEVIRMCAASDLGREDTWINEPIIEMYLNLFDMGHLHTVECWQGDRLVGGLYGVAIEGAFFGESMFSIERDASKIALVSLVARLRVGGFKLLDCQFMNRHLEQFGATPLHRVAFRKMLDEAVEVTAAFPEVLSDYELRQFLQSSNQTSKTGCSIALSAGEEANIQPWKTGSGSLSFGNS